VTPVADSLPRKGIIKIFKLSKNLVQYPNPHGAAFNFHLDPDPASECGSGSIVANIFHSVALSSQIHGWMLIQICIEIIAWSGHAKKRYRSVTLHEMFIYSQVQKFSMSVQNLAVMPIHLYYQEITSHFDKFSM
jgi:hypothetical protein